MSPAASYTPPALIAGTDDGIPQPSFLEELMPFSPQNRMKTFLVIAMLIDSMIVIGGVVWLQRYNAGANSTPLAYAILGFGGLGLKELLVMIHNHQESRQTRHDLRGAIGKTTEIVQEAAVEMKKATNGGLSAAVREVGEQVRQAERDQVLAEVVHRQEFKEMVTTVAAEAARLACEEMQRTQNKQ